MLGYNGRSNRRDFIGGYALLAIGPMPYAMAVQRLVLPWMRAELDRGTFLALALLLAVLTTALMIVCLWGSTVLLTRRSRDIGWPAWVGVVGAAVATALAYVVGVPVVFALIGLMAAVPGRRGLSDAEIRASAFG